MVQLKVMAAWRLTPRYVRRSPVGPQTGAGGGIGGLGTGDRGEHEAAVLRGARERTQLVRRPAQGHGAMATHSAVRGPESGDPAERRWKLDRAPCFRADGERYQAGAHRGAR